MLEHETSAPTALHDKQPSFSTLLSAGARRGPRRVSAFSLSVILHTLAIAVMTLWSVDAPQGKAVSSPKRRYSVRFLQLAPLQEIKQRALAATAGQGAGAMKSRGLPNLQARLTERAPGNLAGSEGSEAKPAAETARPERRRFQLPPTAHVDPVKQSLVQMDLPPNILMKQDIPLPTVVLWTETGPAPPMKKTFVAPPIKEVPKVVQHLPRAPILERPNLETNVADLNMASTVLTDTPHLVRPPGIAPPISSKGQQAAKEIPKIRVADSTQPSAANVISLPVNPSQTSRLLVLPPVNQVAPSDAGNDGISTASGSAGGAGSSGTEGRGLSASSQVTSESAGRGIAGGGSGTAAGVNGSPGGSSSSGKTPNSGNGIPRSGAGGTGTGSSGSAASGSGTSGSLGTLGDMAGVTRITLPKDGKFGVVVLGSAGSTPYPESVGALSGKVVYTVYMKVGLRKSWILQYCLPKATGLNAVNGTSTTPLVAPWPFLILRPDQLADADTDYIIVHGILNSAGQFDQLAMVFPAELNKKDLLLKSLKLWAFRPASRDGVPVAVEVLLIIPREDG